MSVREITFHEAINEAMRLEMRRDNRVILVGEDVAGGATETKVRNGLKIILSDQRVKAVLINIFGGIMRCDVLARGVVRAAKEEGIKVPLIIRLEGTNVEEGREILENSGLNFSVAKDLEEAAKMVAKQVK